MFNDLLLLAIAVPLVIIAIFLLGISVVWFIGYRRRLAYKNFVSTLPGADERNNAKDVPTPAPAEPLPPGLAFNAPPAPPQTLDPAAVQAALASLADSLNTTMATMQTHAHWFGAIRQQFDAHNAGFSAMEGEIRRVDAQIHSLRNPMKSGKMYSTIGDFLTKPGEEAPKLPKPNQPLVQPAQQQDDDDDEPGPNDIDEPDAEFDDDGNMIAIKPTKAEPDPAPLPEIPDKSLPIPKSLLKKKGKR